jgi:nucleotide-binding universal stress UspA family protein
MISQDQNQTSLIEETVNAFDSGISNLEPLDGVAFIDRWLDRLDQVGDELTNEIADTLEELRAELDTETIEGDPDPTAVADILQDLINQTQAVIKSAEASAEQQELSQLVATLENLHRQVSATITEP